MDTFDQQPGPDSVPPPPTDDNGVPSEPGSRRRGIRPLWAIAMTIGALFVGCAAGIAGSGSDDEPSSTVADDGRVGELEEELASVEAERDELQQEVADAGEAAPPEDSGRVEELEAEITRLEGDLEAAEGEREGQGTTIEELTAENEGQAATIEQMDVAASEAAAAALGVAPEDAGTDKETVAAVIEGGRVEFAEALESDVIEFDTVDSFTFDPASDTLAIAASTSFSGAEYTQDGGWAAYRALSQLFEDVSYAPTVTLSVAGSEAGTVSFACSGDFMSRLADRTVDRAAWEAEC